MSFWHGVASAICDATRRPFIISNTTPVSGGSINRAFRIEGKDGTRYFLKLNDVRHHAMFVAEFAGLRTIAATGTLRVPHPITHGIASDQCFLVMEYLELGSCGNAKSLGEQLAALHRCTSPQFGFAHDNFIGTMPQPNTWSDDWMSFWHRQRLGFQLKLAAKNGYDGELQRLGSRLLDALPAFFEGHSPQPSLLHGDLWSGNYAYLIDGTPALFDTAAYYGDRECDLAMTELFGGYSADFYDAYSAAWPLNKGYATRRELYNLYHILNHTNLFGGDYARQAASLMHSLLRLI